MIIDAYDDAAHSLIAAGVATQLPTREYIAPGLRFQCGATGLSFEIKKLLANNRVLVEGAARRKRVVSRKFVESHLS